MSELSHEALVQNMERLSEVLEDGDGTIQADSVADILNRLLEGDTAENIIEDFGLDNDTGI